MAALRIEFRFLIPQFCYRILRDLEQVTRFLSVLFSHLGNDGQIIVFYLTAITRL